MNFFLNDSRTFFISVTYFILNDSNYIRILVLSFWLLEAIQQMIAIMREKVTQLIIKRNINWTLFKTQSNDSISESF